MFITFKNHFLIRHFAVVAFLLMITASINAQFVLSKSCSVMPILATNKSIIHPFNGPVSSNQTGDEWPMFHGGLNHTGTTTTMQIQGTEPLWSYTTGYGIDSSPAVVNGRVYVGSGDKNVYCLNASSGTLNWSYATSNYIGSSPAIAGGCVYIGNYDGRIYSLNANNGNPVWNYNTSNDVESSPAVAYGLVYVGSGNGKLYCLNATTGASAWNYTTGNAVASSPAVAGGLVYIGSTDNKTYCLNAVTGKFVWNYTMGSYVYSSPAVAGDRVYIGSGDGKLYCLNATTGKFIWNYVSGNAILSSPAIASGRVYAVNYDDRVFCINAITGASIWNYTTGGFFSSPAIVNNYLYVGGGDNVCCLNATTGTLVWSYSTLGGVYSSPAIAEGRVYVGCYDNKIYCLPMIMTPTAPTLKASSVYGQVVLTWYMPSSTYASPIINYNIYRSMTSGSEELLLAVGNVTTYNDSNVSNGYMYFYKVSAVSMVGEGARSNEVNVSVVATAPSSPRNFYATVGNEQVVLSWQAPACNGGSPITGYNVYCGAAPSGETYLTTTNNVTTYNDTGLTNGQIYYFTVAAVNANGPGVNATETSATPATIPTSPQSFTATADNARVELSWKVPASNGGLPIIGYKIFRGTVAGAEVYLASVGTVNTWTDTKVTNGQSFFYTICAINGVGLGANASEVVAIPMMRVSGAPRSLQASVENGQVVLSWEAPTDNGGLPLTGYKIYRGTAPCNETLLVTVSNVTTYTDTNVIGGQVYYYKICATTSAGDGALSNEASATLPSSNILPLIIIIVIVGITIAAIAAVLIAYTRKKKR